MGRWQGRGLGAASAAAAGVALRLLGRPSGSFGALFWWDWTRICWEPVQLVHVEKWLGVWRRPCPACRRNSSTVLPSLGIPLF